MYTRWQVSVVPQVCLLGAFFAEDGTTTVFYFSIAFEIKCCNVLIFNFYPFHSVIMQ